MLNNLVATIFIAMSIAFLWSGPQNWELIPLTTQMSVIFFKKKGKEGFWKQVENLINPLLCFYFIVTFIQASVTDDSAFVLLFNGVFAVWTAVSSYYRLVIKSKK